MKQLYDDMADKSKRKTYSSWYSHVVTHRSTDQPVNCLCLAERTGCPVLSCLWPSVRPPASQDSTEEKVAHASSGKRIAYEIINQSEEKGGLA
ncbi:hypothetical protein BDV97DRAFT_30558 [Delphinella strobiligena]|nr:hypothetical protein BDV97DRAFT_30558 [Delphinella strobiligena]